MEAADYSIEFTLRDGVLHAHVTGASSLQATIGYWRDIAREARKHDARLLLLVDEVRGAPLDEADWHQLVNAVQDEGLQRLRIAHAKPGGLQAMEFCEIFARESGIEAKVFDNEAMAEIWLRYGER